MLNIDKLQKQGFFHDIRTLKSIAIEFLDYNLRIAECLQTSTPTLIFIVSDIRKYVVDNRFHLIGLFEKLQALYRHQFHVQINADNEVLFFDDEVNPHLKAWPFEELKKACIPIQELIQYLEPPLSTQTILTPRQPSVFFSPVFSSVRALRKPPLKVQGIASKNRKNLFQKEVFFKDLGLPKTKPIGSNEIGYKSRKSAKNCNKQKSNNLGFRLIGFSSE